MTNTRAPKGEAAQRGFLRLAEGRSLDLVGSPLIMGVLNVTPDSFYPGSRAANLERALEAARSMIVDGADIVDIGGESSRPGASYVEAAEEVRRILPVVAALRRESQIPISVDTRKAEVAAAALDAGADIVNDISALADDRDLPRLVRERGVTVVLMHMRGTPRTMQDAPNFGDTVAEVRSELGRSVERALQAGIAAEQIVVDPGIGFGKRMEDNLRLLRGIPELRALGYPVLIGLSRKSFIGKILNDRPVEGRMIGSIAANLYAALAGADILRVHDVAETVDALKVLKAIGGAS